MENVKELIRKNLRMEFGGASNVYSSFCLQDATEDDAVNVLAAFVTDYLRAESEALDFIERMCTYAKDESDKKTGYEFVIHGTMPGLAMHFSKYWPGKLCIGEQSWDYCFVDLYKDGKQAIPGADYKIRTNTVQDPDNDDYYVVDYSIYDLDKKLICSGGQGMVSEDDVSAFRNLKHDCDKYDASKATNSSIPEKLADIDKILRREAQTGLHNETIRLNFTWDDEDDLKEVLIRIPNEVSAEELQEVLLLAHEYLCNEDSEDLYGIKGRNAETLLDFICERSEWVWKWQDIRFFVDLNLD